MYCLLKPCRKREQVPKLITQRIQAFLCKLLSERIVLLSVSIRLLRRLLLSCVILLELGLNSLHSRFPLRSLSLSVFRTVTYLGIDNLLEGHVCLLSVLLDVLLGEDAGLTQCVLVLSHLLIGKPVRLGGEVHCNTTLHRAFVGDAVIGVKVFQQLVVVLVPCEVGTEGRTGELRVEGCVSDQGAAIINRMSLCAPLQVIVSRILSIARLLDLSIECVRGVSLYGVALGIFQLGDRVAIQIVILPHCGVLIVGVVIVHINTNQLRKDRQHTAGVVRDYHTEQRTVQHSQDLRIGHTDCDITNIRRVSRIELQCDNILHTNGLDKRLTLGSSISCVIVKTDHILLTINRHRNTVLGSGRKQASEFLAHTSFHMSDQGAIPLGTGHTEQAQTHNFLGVAVERKSLSRKVSKDLNIVKDILDHEVGEGLDSGTADIVQISTHCLVLDSLLMCSLTLLEILLAFALGFCQCTVLVLNLGNISLRTLNSIVGDTLYLSECQHSDLTCIRVEVLHDLRRCCTVARFHNREQATVMLTQCSQAFGRKEVFHRQLLLQGRKRIQQSTHSGNAVTLTQVDIALIVFVCSLKLSCERIDVCIRQLFHFALCKTEVVCVRIALFYLCIPLGHNGLCPSLELESSGFNEAAKTGRFKSILTQDLIHFRNSCTIIIHLIEDTVTDQSAHKVHIGHTLLADQGEVDVHRVIAIVHDCGHDLFAGLYISHDLCDQMIGQVCVTHLFCVSGSKDLDVIQGIIHKGERFLDLSICVSVLTKGRFQLFSATVLVCIHRIHQSITTLVCGYK